MKFLVVDIWEEIDVQIVEGESVGDVYHQVRKNEIEMLRPEADDIDEEYRSVTDYYPEYEEGNLLIVPLSEVEDGSWHEAVEAKAN